jgi:hypothetical protein
MAGITQAQAETELQNALDTLTAVRKGEFQVRDRKVKPPTLEEAMAEVKFWDEMVRKKSAEGTRTGRRMRGGTPT